MMREQFALSMALVLTLGVLPSAVRAQTPPPATTLPPAAPPPAVMQTPPSMPPREPLPPPPGIRPFATPQELVGRELGLEEAVNIGLENAPLIVARIGDYIAAQQRVNQALAPLLPQLTGSGNYGRLRSLSTVTGDAGSPATSAPRASPPRSSCSTSGGRGRPRTRPSPARSRSRKCSSRRSSTSPSS